LCDGATDIPVFVRQCFAQRRGSRSADWNQCLNCSVANARIFVLDGYSD
jgi:hypothetical protein